MPAFELPHPCTKLARENYHSLNWQYNENSDLSGTVRVCQSEIEFSLDVDKLVKKREKVAHKAFSLILWHYHSERQFYERITKGIVSPPILHPIFWKRTLDALQELCKTDDQREQTLLLCDELKNGAEKYESLARELFTRRFRLPTATQLKNEQGHVLDQRAYDEIKSGVYVQSSDISFVTSDPLASAVFHCLGWHKEKNSKQAGFWQKEPDKLVLQRKA